MKSVFAVLAMTLLVGCNDVANGYRPVVNLSEVQKAGWVDFSDNDAEYREGSKDTRQDIQEARRQGWMMLGYSVFPDNPTMQQQIRDHGRKLKAGLVIVSLLGTQQTSTMTTVSTSTGPLFLPMSGVARTYGASFWAKENLKSVGFYGRNLTQEEAIKRGDGNGVVVATVAKGYGADRAGIQEGDIITHIAGKEVINMLDAMTILQTSGIAAVDIKVQRDGKPLSMTMETGRVPEGGDSSPAS